MTRVMRSGPADAEQQNNPFNFNRTFHLLQKADILIC
jgi:hypothetical protein